MDIARVAARIFSLSWSLDFVAPEIRAYIYIYIYMYVLDLKCAEGHEHRAALRPWSASFTASLNLTEVSPAGLWCMGSKGQSGRGKKKTESKAPVPGDQLSSAFRKMWRHSPSEDHSTWSLLSWPLYFHVLCWRPDPGVVGTSTGTWKPKSLYSMECNAWWKQ